MISKLECVIWYGIGVVEQVPGVLSLQDKSRDSKCNTNQESIARKRQLTELLVLDKPKAQLDGGKGGADGGLISRSFRLSSGH